MERGVNSNEFQRASGAQGYVGADGEPDEPTLVVCSDDFKNGIWGHCYSDGTEVPGCPGVPAGWRIVREGRAVEVVRRMYEPKHGDLSA